MSDSIDLPAARNNLTKAIEAFLAATGSPDLVPTAWVMTVNCKDVNFTVGQTHVTTEHMGDMSTVLGLNKIQSMELDALVMEELSASY
jgi:hypothetical protein